MIYVASTHASSFWSSVPNSAWYRYQRGEEPSKRTCATTAYSFLMRLQMAIQSRIGGLPASGTWDASWTSRLHLAIMMSGVSDSVIPFRSNESEWTREMLVYAIWWLYHQGESSPQNIMLPSQVVLPRYGEPFPRDQSTPGSPSGPVCFDGEPVARPLSAVPGVTSENVPLLVLAGLVTVFAAGAAWVRWGKASSG